MTTITSISLLQDKTLTASSYQASGSGLRRQPASRMPIPNSLHGRATVPNVRIGISIPLQERWLIGNTMIS